MIISIIFVIIEIFFLINLMKFKLTDKTVAVCTQIPLAFVFIMAFHAMIAGLLSLVHININLYSIGFFDLIMSIVIFSKYKRTGTQKYEISGKNYLFYILLTIGVLLFGLVLFGRNLEIHFWSVDASAHYGMARHVVKNQSFNTNLYFSALNNGIAMMIAKSFIGEQYLYKVFIIMELWDLWIAGALFYGFINQVKQDKGIKSIIITAIYLLGYPLYAIIFGFSYFGAAISLIVATMCWIEKKECSEIDNKLFLVFANLLLFSLFVCYTYLVPVMFGTLFLLIFIDYLKKTGKILTKEMLLEQLKVFLLPCCLGMIFSISNLKELGAGGGITNPGGCYFDLYSNFIVFSIFIGVGIYLTFKDRLFLSVHLLSALSIIFLVLLLVMNLHGKASIYYVSKIYNVIWFCSFIYFFIGISFIFEKLQSIKLSILISLMVSIILPLFINFSGVFSEPGYIRMNGISLVPDIYSFNYSARMTSYITDEEIASYKYISTTYGKNNEDIIAIGNEVNCGWFRAISSQNLSVSYEMDDLFNKIDKQVKYLYCMKSSFLVNENTSLLENLGKIIYSDQFGFLIELD